ncbi:DnaJ family domain-containing protein [Paenibacillus sp. FSL W8-0194]|uniref:DnaJ family domain-containing protein n=1 Tax=Paenibacillus sp. FSL W8-0194 TaxID=2921711 RepID=UPI0030D8FB62
MGLMSWLAEERIHKAMEQGEFKDLAGKGKPLELEDLSHIPEDLRMSYKVMKNAGVIPEEMQLQGELLKLRDLIYACENAGEKEKLKRSLTEKKLRFQMLMEQRGLSGSTAFLEYEPKIRGRLEDA